MSKTWQQRVISLGPYLESNKLTIDLIDLTYALNLFSITPVKITDLTAYVATLGHYPINHSPIYTWDQYLRILIVLADVLGNAVYSNDNLEGLAEKYRDVDDKKIDAYIKQLVTAGVAYQIGNVNSYLTNVRNKGKVAYDEGQMMLSYARPSKHKIMYRDVEFPYDSNGRYIVDHLPAGWTYISFEGFNAYSPPP